LKENTAVKHCILQTRIHKVMGKLAGLGIVVTGTHIKGHSGEAGNEAVDWAAKRELEAPDGPPQPKYWAPLQPVLNTPRPLIVFSLFDGIGGTWEALAKLHWKPARAYSAEILPEANLVLRRRYPFVQHIDDVTKVSREWLIQQVSTWPKNALILLVAGSPCQGNSRLKGTHRQGLKGDSSGLFWEVVRFQEILRTSLLPTQHLHTLWLRMWRELTLPTVQKCRLPCDPKLRSSLTLRRFRGLIDRDSGGPHRP
jgi:hypothetical protein